MIVAVLKWWIRFHDDVNMILMNVMVALEIIMGSEISLRSKIINTFDLFWSLLFSERSWGWFSALVRKMSAK
jgi:hypothetical protein